jgi:hypothetical protein
MTDTLRALAHQPLEGAPIWKKSSACPNAATCVEVAVLPDGSVAVRDGKNPHLPALTFDAERWTGFVKAVRDGEFDPAAR